MSDIAFIAVVFALLIAFIVLVVLASGFASTLMANLQNDRTNLAHQMDETNRRAFALLDKIEGLIEQNVNGVVVRSGDYVSAPVLPDSKPEDSEEFKVFPDPLGQGEI